MAMAFAVIGAAFGNFVCDLTDAAAKSASGFPYGTLCCNSLFGARVRVGARVGAVLG